MGIWKIRGTARIEGIFLLVIGIAIAWFALLGRYEYLMNPKFRWLTVTGAALVVGMGIVLLLRPRKNAELPGLLAFLLISGIVLIGKPHLYDVNSLTLPDAQGISEVPLSIGETRYKFIGIKEMNASIVPGREGYGGRKIVITGLLKRSPALDGEGRLAVMRPVSVCCAADALMVGMLADGSADSSLTDQWVNVYGTVRLSEDPVPRPRIRHGAIRYASVSESYILAADSIAPYIRPKPKESIMDKLASENFSTFHRLAGKADLERLLEEYEMVTVFAPVNAAFESLLEGAVEELLEKKNHEDLVQFVGRHVVAGVLKGSDLQDIEKAVAISGDTLSFSFVNGKPIVEGSRLLFKNIEANDGVVHAIYPVISK